MLFPRKQLNNTPDSEDQLLKQTKRNVWKQAGLAIFTVAVVMILVFARTAAWYTNIVTTGGMTFEAEAWGFEGGVEISEDPIQAAPGDEGWVNMKITNTGKLPSAVSVNISKEYMATELQQRIYFYADRQQQLNGETVQRQYLNNVGGYTYFLPGQNQLILSEEVYTDVQLKWMWVYDVVGYYFRGTNDGADFTVEEYLRPVEYDYTTAVYDKETGKLEMVDEETSAAQFVAALTAQDGYSGAFTAGAENTLFLDGHLVSATNGCYPIDEEKNIWLYLCTKQEIQQNTYWDTQFGLNEDAQNRAFQARIAVTGQQLSQQTTQVADLTNLEAALKANDGSLITLQQDIVLTQPLVLEEGTQAVLDLNGHHISSAANTVFDVRSGAALTVMDGAITGDGEHTVAFQSVGGTVTMSNLQISDVYNALLVADHTTDSENGDNSLVRITGCDLQTEDVAVLVSGDGSASDRKTAVLIQDTTIESGYIAISGNGTATNPGRWGTDIQIVNSTVSGLYAGVYHPQMNSSLTISGSEISGWTGIAIKGGSLKVMDSTITGTGTNSQVTVPTEDNVSKSGFVDSGDGIYAETVYEYSIQISVSGDSFIRCTAQTAKAVRVFPESELVTLQLTGGTYDTDVTELLQEGYTCQSTESGYKVAPKN